jgi:hypothetical protein
MQNATSAGETHDDAFIERLALSIIAKFQADGLSLTKEFLLECFVDFFRQEMGSSDLEAVTGIPAEIMVVFFDDRRSQFRARYAPCVDRAFAAWEAAARANGGVAN